MKQQSRGGGGSMRSKISPIVWVVLMLILFAVGVRVGRNLWEEDIVADVETVDVETEVTETEEPEEFLPDTDLNASEWDGTDYEIEESDGILVPSYSSITIPSGKETVSMTLANPEGNSCYFTFYLVLQDTGEVLYSSGLVPPGQAITSVTLNRTLKSGEYNVIIQIATTSIEDGSAMSSANIKTKLLVQKQ